MEKVMVFEGKTIKVTKEEHDAYVASISNQSPTDEEVRLHYLYCDSKSVHPLEKLIHFTKRNGRYTPVTSIDYMRIRAESSEVYAGSDDAVFAESGRKLPVAATVTVWKMVQGKLGRFTATARWDEYAPADLNSRSAFLWKKMPHTMLAKCAEALALRKAFPGQLHGLYAKEEMAQDGRYVTEDADMNYDQWNNGENQDSDYLEDQPDGQESPQEAPQATENTNPTEATSEEQKEPGNRISVYDLKRGENVNAIKAATGADIPSIMKVIGGLDKSQKYTIEQVVEKVK